MPGNEPRSSRLRYRLFRTERKWKDFRHDQGGGDEESLYKDKAKAKEKDKPARGVYLSRYRELIRPYRKRVIVLLMMGFIAAVLEMAQPAALGLIIDGILLSETLTNSDKILWLNVSCAAILVMVVISRLIDTLRNIYTISLNHRIIVRLRRRLHHHMLKLGLADLSDLKTGTIVSRLSNDVEKLRACCKWQL